MTRTVIKTTGIPDDLRDLATRLDAFCTELAATLEIDRERVVNALFAYEIKTGCGFTKAAEFLLWWAKRYGELWGCGDE